MIPESAKAQLATISISDIIQLMNMEGIKKAAGKKLFLNIELGKISVLEITNFTKHLSVMVKSGITVHEAIETLAAKTRPGRFKEVLESIKQDLSSGFSFTAAIEKSKNLFETQLGTAATGAAIATGGCAVTADAAVDLSNPLAKYLASMPVDPDGTAALTGYSVKVDANGIVTVRACMAENSSDIYISR